MHNTRHPADNLDTIRENWGSLLAARTEQPDGHLLFTRPSVAYLAALREQAAIEYAERNELAWGETAAPLRLSIVDTITAVTHGLVELEDAVRDVLAEAPADRAGMTSHAAAHWAALAVRIRLTRRDDGGPVIREGTEIWEHVEAETFRMRRLVTSALGIHDGPIHVPFPCPWCHGNLVIHTHDTSRGPYATCGTGESCGAPVPLEGGQRTWGWRQLGALGTAVNAKGTAAA